MKRISQSYKMWMCIFSAILLGISTTGCSLMDTDRDDCPEGLYVDFVYDYNIQRADMFKDHVGYVTVYVFDESDNLVTKRSVGNYDTDAPLKEYGYKMHFTQEELPAGTYHLMALAMQKDWDEALSTPGAKYRRTEPQTRSAARSEISVTLDRGAKTTESLCPVDNVSPMDTLWHGTMLGASSVTIVNDQPSYATISMVRDTKVLHLNLRDIDNPADPAHDKYEVRIMAKNGRLDADNNVINDDMLLYQPFASWTTQFPEDAATAADVEERTAHYDINFNRIMYRSSTENDAMLVLINKDNNNVIGEFDLAWILSEGRGAFETANYSRQEYLDREYDYHLDFFLKGDRWYYVAIHVGILSWTRRITNTEL
ncbi:MAG: FimB/Mfa2 family fimbrial subunit [Prevotellaceae bacterium]|nr:FimB/Mfa2 family fimbrial subunit [Prevotellaceae bacterium]